MSNKLTHKLKIEHYGRRSVLVSNVRKASVALSKDLLCEGVLRKSTYLQIYCGNLCSNSKISIICSLVL